jgi:hypothetical protein
VNMVRSFFQRHAKKLGLAGTLVALFASSSARAQVNTDTLRPGPVREGFSGGIDGSVMKLGGNVELLDLALGGRIQTLRFFAPKEGEEATQRTVKNLAVLMGSFHYTARIPQAIVNQALLHGRFMHMWHPRIGSVIFVQHQFNEFQRLRVRSVWGTSISMPLVHHRVFNLSVGSGYMFEYNRISVLPGASDAPQTFEHRWSNFFGVRINAFDGRLICQSTTYMQPRWDKLGDFRFLEEVEVLAKVNDMLGFGATFSFLHDSAPPTGVKNTDTRIASNVRLSF